MTRRFWGIVLSVLLACLALAVTGCGRREPEARVTNLILIVVDTLRPDHVGCYGYAYIRTPTMDALAENGTLFEQAITPVPVTLPAFASLVTSTYPPTHGVRDNGLYSLSEEMLTLAEVLREKKFKTAAFLGSAVMDSSYGLAQGFATYDDDFKGYYYPSRPEYLPLAEELRRNQRRAEIVTRNALAWIKGNKRARFFVLLHYFDPHAFYDPPAPFDSIYAQNPYDGEIAYTDHHIGFLLDAVRSFRIPGRTLVVLTADHGEGLMEHNEAQHGLLIYDTTLEIPLIFYCPEVCPPGMRLTRQVSLVDLAPTVLSLLGVECPDAFQGTDLSPLFEGMGVASPEAVYCETYRPRLSYGWSELVGIRTEEWKYIRAPKPELYDLVRDSRESDNLAGTGLPAENDMIDRMEGLLASFAGGESHPATELPRDEITRERLQSLGYLAGMGPRSEAAGEPLPDPKDQMEAFNLRQLAGYHSRVGSALIEAGHLAGALAALERAAEIEPESALRYTNLGAVHVRRGNYAKAVSSYREALRINPGYLPAHTGLAHLYEARGDTVSAIDSYRRALDSAPSFEEAVVGVSRLEIERGNPERAVRFLEKALEETPENTTLLTIFTEALRRSGDYGRAAEYLEKLASLQPLNPGPPFYLAHALARLGARDDAIRWYERAIELDPKLSEAYYNIACIHSLENRKDEAIEWLRQALENGFDDFEHMKRDPELESLHGDPRFMSLSDTGA